jgi:hypothetical protein
VRHQPPLVAGLNDVAKSVEDLAQRVVALRGVLVISLL